MSKYLLVIIQIGLQLGLLLKLAVPFYQKFADSALALSDMSEFTFPTLLIYSPVYSFQLICISLLLIDAVLHTSPILLTMFIVLYGILSAISVIMTTELYSANVSDIMDNELFHNILIAIPITQVS